MSSIAFDQLFLLSDYFSEKENVLANKSKIMFKILPKLIIVFQLKNTGTQRHIASTRIHKAMQMRDDFDKLIET